MQENERSISLEKSAVHSSRAVQSSGRVEESSGTVESNRVYSTLCRPVFGRILADELTFSTNLKLVISLDSTSSSHGDETLINQVD